MTAVATQPSRTRMPLLGAPLTERELDVLLRISEGNSNGEIGVLLHLSEDTVKTHCRRLFRKLGARDRAHAVARGFQVGLITAAPESARREGDTHVIGCPALTPPLRCECRFGGQR